VLEGEVDSIAAKMASLNDQLATLGSSRDATQNELDALRGQLSDTEGQLGTARGKIDELMAVKITAEEALLRERQSAESVAATIGEELRVAGVEGATVGVRADNTIGIRVASGSLFGTGSSNLSNTGREVLGTVTSKVAGFNDYDIRVEGHTDDVPIGAALARIFKSNWELSVARAASAVRYMSSNGVDASRLSAIGYGQFSPIADNDTESGREQNRRVEVVLHPR